MKNKGNTLFEIKRFASILGLQKNEVDLIIKNNNEKETIIMSTGPNWYPGAHYGSISINDF